jgi:hypothetical protein
MKNEESRMKNANFFSEPVALALAKKKNNNRRGF